jgi:hypothetical protein
MYAQLMTTGDLQVWPAVYSHVGICLMDTMSATTFTLKQLTTAVCELTLLMTAVCELTLLMAAGCLILDC